MIVSRCSLLLWALALASSTRSVRGGYYANRYYYNNNDDAGNDDGNNNNNEEEGDENENGEDAQENAAVDDTVAAEYAEENYEDDWVASNRNVDDDMFHWSDNVGFDGVNIMPLSCINYNNGHLIKFSFFNGDSSYQCHFDEIGTFVVSIAHYMRAYFNYQALVYGQDFYLPPDAGYLNCALLSETEGSDEPLYAKISCQERETFTSTKLALKVYTDAQCSEAYDDGKSTHYHASKGYIVDGNLISSQITFRPPFYKCDGCQPNAVSSSFNRYKVSWYDDDYISANGERQENQQQEEEENQDDYFNDDFSDDNFNNQNYYGNRKLIRSSSTRDAKVRQLASAERHLEAYEKEFWEEIDENRKLENNYDVGDWNICERVYKYGIWCDDDCRSLDQFRTDVWSGADIILLSIMCTFVAGMMMLIVAKRLKAAEKSRRFAGLRSPHMPGLPPLAMLALFVCMMTIIGILASLHFVNETLVFAVFTCLLVFIYMLKITLFDNNRQPVLLAAPNSDWDFDNQMDERLH